MIGNRTDQIFAIARILLSNRTMSEEPRRHIRELAIGISMSRSKKGTNCSDLGRKGGYEGNCPTESSHWSFDADETSIFDSGRYGVLAGFYACFTVSGRARTSRMPVPEYMNEEAVTRVKG